MRGDERRGIPAGARLARDLPAHAPGPDGKPNDGVGASGDTGAVRRRAAGPLRRAQLAHADLHLTGPLSDITSPSPALRRTPCPTRIRAFTVAPPPLELCTPASRIGCASHRASATGSSVRTAEAPSSHRSRP